MAKVKKIVAVLDSMWGGGQGRATSYFRINPYNRSGNRLYSLLGSWGRYLWVTNCCPEMQIDANHHGKPDPGYLAKNLTSLEPISLILVMGEVAKSTFEKIGYNTNARILILKHPAARNWTNQEIQSTAGKIRYLLLQKDADCTLTMSK